MNEELLPENVDFDEPHIITEKLDGSMCSPALINGKIEWITRMGITFISEQVEAWLKADLVRNKNYTRFAEAMIHQNSTPIFEWCSRKNRVVIDHPVDMLVLTAIRWNDTGRYCSLGYFNFVAENFNIEVVKTFDYDAKNILDIVRSQENTEGVVIRFNDGHMIKCKSDWYVSIHRAKSFITNERQVTKAIVEGTIDDVLPLLPVEDRDMVTTFQKKLFDIISRKTIRFHQLAKERIDMFPTPKEYALSDKFKRDVNLLTTLMFSVYNKKIELVVETVHEHIINYMKRHLNNTKNYDDMKTLLFPRLDYRFEYQEN